MDIDLSNLENLGSKREIEAEVEFDDLDFQQRKVQIPELLKLNLVIYRGDKSFIFNGHIRGNFSLQCSRCLDDFLLQINEEVDKEVLLKDIKDLHHFDLNELLRPYLFLAVPIKPLCDEECEGLCPECGQNLNEGDCDCQVEDLDPRMAKLKDLYDKKD